MKGKTIKIRSVVKQGITRQRYDYATKTVADGSFVDENGNLIITNDFPQYWANITNASPVAKACLRVLSRFCKGRGFKEWGALSIGENPLNALLEQVSIDFTGLDRFALLVEYKMEAGLEGVAYKESGLKIIPSEWWRYHIPEDIATGEITKVVYNPFLQTSEALTRLQETTYKIYTGVAPTDNDIAFFDAWNNQEGVSESERKKYAEVLIVNLTDLGNRTYSRPSGFSAEQAILLDANVWKFHNRNAENGFFLSGFMTVYGDPNQKVEPDNPHSLTLEEVFNNSVQDLYAGANNAGGVMTIWQETPNDNAPSFTPISANDNDELFDKLFAQIKEVIVTAFNVPSILANIQQAGKLGTSQEIELAVQVLNSYIAQYQKIICDTLTPVVRRITGNSALNLEIVPLPSTIELPQYIFESLTQESKNAYILEKYGIDNTTQAPVL